MRYRRLHPTKEGKRKYRFTTTEVVKEKLRGRLANHPDCTFRDRHGIAWASIRAGYIYIAVGYSWNGSSPKYYVGYPPVGKWIGTPDFEGTIIASLIHDVLFQFAEVGKYTFHDANYQFLCIMEEADFKLAQHYYDAVEAFGIKYWGHDGEGVTAEYHTPQ